MTRINFWKADSECLEVSIKVKPWDRYYYYRRILVQESAGSFSLVWRWVDGNKESSQKSCANEEIQDILDELVLNDPVLNRFCSIYGIGE